MAKLSAGILLYRRSNTHLEFLLVHPGGPFWANKDEHAWSIPKGLSTDSMPDGDSGNEEIEETARREFHEETGMKYDGKLVPLEPVKTSGGKIIHAFLGEGDFDTAKIKSNIFEMEWPPRSGRMQSFPEVDKAAWFDTETALSKIHKGQIPVIEIAVEILNS